MTRKIPIKELRRTEAACNALANLQQDHRPLIRTLEGQYGASIQERRIRHIEAVALDLNKYSWLKTTRSKGLPKALDACRHASSLYWGDGSAGAASDVEPLAGAYGLRGFLTGSPWFYCRTLRAIQNGVAAF